MPISNEDYVKKEGSVCPSCLGKDITGRSVEVDSGYAWQTVSCDDCGASWNDIYKLTGYTDFQEGSDEQD